MIHKEKRIICGIDPGIGVLGYGILLSYKNNLSCLGYGHIRTKNTIIFPERLSLIFKETQKIFSTYMPSIVGIEKIYFTKNITTCIEVSHARGVIILAATHARIPIVECTPLQVKQAVTGYGKAEKHQIQNMVMSLLSLPKKPSPDDAADALAIAIYASQQMNQ